jgi:hypothetical protein
MAGAKIKLNTSPAIVGEANGDTAGNLSVALPLDPLFAGYSRNMGEVDAGRVTGVAYLLPPETSEDFRSRVELDTILDSHTFNETAQYTGKHIYRNTTMTNTWSGNALNTNASGITTINTGTTLQTYQYFPIFGAAQTYAYFNLAFTGAWAVTNTTVDVGLFTNNTTTPFAPTDGVYIRANNTGLFGVANFNGTEQTTAPFKAVFGGANFTPTIGTFYDVIVTIGQNIAVFWMDLRDGNGYARMGSLADSVGAGLPSSVANVPFSIRHAIGGTTASGIMGAKIGTYTVSQGGFQNTRSEPMTAALMTGGQQGQAGHTQGSVALYTNSLAPGAGAVMTNTTAALGTGMGGQFSALPTLAVNTDGILCSYLNPIPTAAIAGKQLTIKGVKIDAVVTTVLVGNATPVIYAYSLAYGHNAISLATAEAATTKAPRRIYVGTQTFAAAAALGTIASTVTLNFDRPIPVNPGEYVQIAAKNIGAATTTGVITFFVTFDWGWVL